MAAVADEHGGEGSRRDMPRNPVGVIVLIDYRDAARLSGFMRLAFARWGIGGTRGLRFAKFLGSGQDGKFGVWPSLSHQGMMLSFDDEAAAAEFLRSSPLLTAIRTDARHLLTARLHAYSSRGRWSGQEPFPVTVARPNSGPVASLTRASIRLSKAAEFWRHAPPSQAALAHADGCLLAVGLGEAPVFRQATFTLWDSERAMDAYARSGAHLAAITAARAGRHFSEDMFTRFAVSDVTGDWPGLVKW